MDDWLKSYYKLQKMDWSPTKLSDKEEKQFREWITGTKLFNNLKPIIAQDLEKPVYRQLPKKKKLLIQCTETPLAIPLSKE